VDRPVAIIVEFRDGVPIAQYMKRLNLVERLWYKLVHRRIKPVDGAKPVTGDIGILISRELYHRLLTCDEPVYKAVQQLDTSLIQAKFVTAAHDKQVNRGEPTPV